MDSGRQAVCCDVTLAPTRSPIVSTVAPPSPGGDNSVVSMEPNLGGDTLAPSTLDGESLATSTGGSLAVGVVIFGLVMLYF